MFRQSTPVAPSTDTRRPRLRRPRTASRRPRSIEDQHHHSVVPNELDLGPLFIHTRDAVIVSNLDTGCIVLWNPAAERIFGGSASEAVGQPIEMLIPPALVRVHQERLALYRRTGRGTLIGRDQPLELPALTRSGEEISVELSLAPLDHPRGERQYAIALLRDVSDRHRAQVQSLAASQATSGRKAAEAAIHQHQQVVHQAVEQLRRDLRPLRGSAARLSRNADPQHGERLDLQARVIERRAERLLHSLDVFDTRARLQSGELQPHLERVNLVPLVGRIVADTRARGLPHKLHLAMPQGLTALVDRRLIECALSMVVEQAIARSPRGTWIDIELRRPLTGLARFEVRVFGPPLPEAERHRMRELPQVEPNLALGRTVIERHRGSLVIEFPAEGGAAIVVSLPTNSARAVVSSAQSSERTQDASAAATERTRDASAAATRRAREASAVATERTREASTAATGRTREPSAAAATERTREASTAAARRPREASATGTERTRKASATATRRARKASATATERTRKASATATERTRKASATAPERTREASPAATRRAPEVAARISA